MPYSDDRLRPWIRDELAARDLESFKTVVDVGAGAGTWLDFLRPSTPNAEWTAIEVWGPYIPRFGLEEKYDHVIPGDVRQVELPEADLYIFGDVLEHMQDWEAIRAWYAARAVAKWLVINLPVLRYEQGALEGNPFECHVAHWDYDGVMKAFPGIVSSSRPIENSVCGAFIAEGVGG